MTGHLILTTLHAQTAASAIQRLTDMNIEPSVMATSINCIIAQRLARHVCRTCCEPTVPPPDVLAGLGITQEIPEAAFVRAVGCAECGDTGYRGRVPLFEVMMMTDEIAQLIRAPTREIESMAVAQGMTTLRESGIALAAAGITTLEEVGRVAGNAHHEPNRRSPDRSRRRRTCHLVGRVGRCRHAACDRLAGFASTDFAGAFATTERADLGAFDPRTVASAGRVSGRNEPFASIARTSECR